MTEEGHYVATATWSLVTEEKLEKLKKVDPLALVAALLPKEQKLIKDIEEAASPAEIGNQRWDLWDRIKTIAGDTWSGQKMLLVL